MSWIKRYNQRPDVIEKKRLYKLRRTAELRGDKKRVEELNQAIKAVKKPEPEAPSKPKPILTDVEEYYLKKLST